MYVVGRTRSVGDLGKEVLHIRDAAQLAFYLFVMLGNLLQIMVQLFQEGGAFLILQSLEICLFELFLGVAKDPGQPLVLLADGDVF